MNIKCWGSELYDIPTKLRSYCCLIKIDANFNINEGYFYDENVRKKRLSCRVVPMPYILSQIPFNPKDMPAWTKELKDTNHLMSSLLVICLGWCSNFVGSESGQKQSVKLLQNMVYSTIQHPPPSHTHCLIIYCTEPAFLNVNGALALIPRTEFRQPM